MRLSIHSKLFLTILLACVILLIGTHAFVQWSFRRGLVEMADAREQERIEHITDHLIAIYRRDHSWDSLANSRRHWLDTLHPDIPPEPGCGRPLKGKRFRASPPWRKEATNEPGMRPPSQEPNPRSSGNRPTPLEMRLALADQSGNLIHGREPLAPDSRHYPLQLDGAKIGELILTPGPPLPEDAEIRFRSTQGDRLWIIAVGMLLLSAVLAYPLSRRLVRPVRDFQDATRQLAAGNYSARVPVHGSDEIAKLGRDINALAGALERNEQTRRRWVADISHELRTPIALLFAELEALQDGIRPLNRGSLDTLHADALRLGRLVDDLYELSTTDMGALGYRMEPTEVGEILGADIDAFRRRFEESGLRLEYRSSLEDPTFIHADGQRLSQLFRNLLRNSLQYTDAGGGLTVTIARQQDRILIDFQDTAPAVQPAALPRLFERLYRVDSSRSRHTGGAGLGLAIAKNVVEAHAGDIHASAAPRGGLWIRIQLPI
ncbi:ATP-binding protein [Imhoffiella purpurea]|uniref:Signal transduction histidine-protein kinase/phosphatase MprB n=1 Tax=Imhoffiella purpurea TaxID=1249627 RepID=W9VG83_9GAMM|nr:ATP-binding protein [Imhoffiella purpurea]EXJ15047.1 Sensory histidine kinase BaeS [Imhoffiella purpurea]